MWFSLAEESTYSNTSSGSLPFPQSYPDSNVHGANMGPIWGRKDPGGPHVGPMNLAIWVVTKHQKHMWCQKEQGWLMAQYYSLWLLQLIQMILCINMARYEYDFI